MRILTDPANLAGSIPTVPLYAFYNPQSVCAVAGVEGIALADAFEIRKVVDDMLAARPSRLPSKRLPSLRPLFFSLADIMCPPAASLRSGSIVGPDVARGGYMRAIEQRGTSSIRAERVVPEVGRDIPDGIRALFSADGARKLSAANIRRPRILISAESEG